MTKFQDKYRSGSSRLKNWDYGNCAPYFVTICVENHQKLLGEIAGGKMVLHKSGEIVQSIWLEIPQKFDYVRLHEFVVMPNHFHGIIVIDKKRKSRDVLMSMDEVKNRRGGFSGDKNPMLNDNLPRVLRWFKGRATFEIRKINPNFNWQGRYWDNVIRSEQAYNNIEHYIINNPSNWKDDKFHNH